MLYCLTWVDLGDCERIRRTQREGESFFVLFFKLGWLCLSGVSQIIVAVNKMDTVEWDQSRYDEIVKKLRQFLKQVGFKEADLSFIPCSGLAGENLTKAPQEPLLTAWYSGPTLVSQIGERRTSFLSQHCGFALGIWSVLYVSASTYKAVT